MCGITAYLGSGNAFDIIMASLFLLQNRGYDSTGIATINQLHELIVSKYASRSEITGLMYVEEEKDRHNNNTIGIGHTRWATHGAKTDINAHPHTDTLKRIAVVHNGIIENYMAIKTKLIAYGIEFVGQTDTEVIPKLLEFYLDKAIIAKNGDITQIDFENDVLKHAIGELEGTWALVIMYSNTPNTLYLCKNGSPLVIGINDTFSIIASEQLPLSMYFNNYITLHDGDIVSIKKDIITNKVHFQNRCAYIENIIQNRVHETTCAPYPYWTIKEIFEQPMCIQRTLNMGGRLLDESHVKLGGLDSNKSHILDADNLIIIGCGTSLHAGYIGAKMMRNLKSFSCVICVDASEFTLDDIPINGKTVFLLLSQSGETKDVHRCINTIRISNHPIISIVNVVGSLIARESDCGIYLNAGREVGVASTKSFTCQIVALSLLALWYAQTKGLSEYIRIQYIRNLRLLDNDIQYTLDSINDQIKYVANTLQDTQHMFILGRDQMQYIAEEAALKIKEICYIHAEGYPCGSLKHGPFALIDSSTVVILIAPQDDNFAKMINAAEEVKSRNARVILITTHGSAYINKSIFEHIIYVPTNSTYQSVISIIPLQLLAYYISVARNINPDFPRNLAKVVTVDG